MYRITFYGIKETKPDGTVTALGMGTFLADGTETDYTVNGDQAYHKCKQLQEKHPENRYELTMERY